MSRDRFEIHERADEESLIKREWKRFDRGTRWKCIRCEDCCRKSWAVNLTWLEYDRLTADPRAADLKIDRLEIDQGTGMTHPYFVIEGRCPLLIERTSSCSIHPDWPYTCATYPFLLTARGELLVHNECSGFGCGDIVDGGAMVRKILLEKRRAGMTAHTSERQSPER